MKQIFGKGRWTDFKHAFTSKTAFVDYCEAPKPEGEKLNRVGPGLFPGQVFIAKM